MWNVIMYVKFVPSGSNLTYIICSISYFNCVTKSSKVHVDICNMQKVEFLIQVFARDHRSNNCWRFSDIISKKLNSLCLEQITNAWQKNCMASPSFSSKWLLIFTFIIDSLWRVFLQIPKISRDIMNIFQYSKWSIECIMNILRYSNPSSANVTSTNVSKNTPLLTKNM